MSGLPRCEVSSTIGRDAGVSEKCYPLKGNQPERLRRGDVFTIDSSVPVSSGALSRLAIPYEPLWPGPAGQLFEVDATDGVTRISRGAPDLDRRGPDDFVFDQGQNETHCRNVYFAAMATYESFRRALGRPVAWAFWREGSYPALKLMPFAEHALNAYYDRNAAAIGFGYGPAGEESDRADRRLIRFTALSSDIVTHEVTHALIDGLRPDYDMPMHPDVFAFHEALADTIALLSRFERGGYLGYLMQRSGLSFLREKSLISLAPQLGGLIRKSGLRTLDVAWTEAAFADGDADMPARYDNAPELPHDRGGLLSSAVFEAFLRALDRRISPLIQLAEPVNSAVGRYLLEQVQQIASRMAGHFLNICIRALDYCPPATILFADYLRAMITADRLLAPLDRFGYREELIAAFRRRGIYPDGIDVVSETALSWDPPEIPVYPIPGLALSAIRYDTSPVMPLSGAEIRRQARALAHAIDADARLARALGLRAPGFAGPGSKLSAPQVTSIRPTLRVGPDGFIDFSMIAEIVQICDTAVEDGRMIRHRGGATLILDPTGTPALTIRQRIDNEQRIEAENRYALRQDSKPHEGNGDLRQHAPICRISQRSPVL